MRQITHDLVEAFIIDATYIARCIMRIFILHYINARVNIQSVQRERKF